MRLGVREKLLYVPAILTGATDKPDYLATIDVDPTSDTYSQVIHRLPMPIVGDELHHMGWNACSSCYGNLSVQTHNYLIAMGLFSGNIYFIDVMSDPRAPVMHKIIEAQELAEKVNVGIPHTAHCAPTEIIICFMGGPEEAGFPSTHNGYVSIDPKTFEINGRWEKGVTRQSFAYDFWYQPRHNVMVSSGWGEPSCFNQGFNPQHVADGKYGQTLYVWDWAKHEIIQELDCGKGSIPLEVRFLHDPASAEGYVGCALSSEIVRFFIGNDSVWNKETVVKIPSVPVEGWALPEMPALITDFVISLDDCFMYVACWLHGDIRQYNISNRCSPKLVGQVHIGGSLNQGSGVNRTDGSPQPETLVVQGVVIQGGPQMIQLSLDGKRLYVTTSLFGPWDQQFYPELMKNGGQLLQVDVDTDMGGLVVNQDFLVDFGKEPYGPARCHEMRLPGGDCTSDIWE